ncbi:MAG: hypothetical protein EZS28_000915 [Streblomastix strix]|uniref:Uncharacterized protein n=1 Tax=Streblomastix strix TaxID=222440 RepID=A0A5J4X8J5_9EUKA|nr:MAG: hypothetical protein EZS28_000915 [Streblomastix strix]
MKMRIAAEGGIRLLLDLLREGIPNNPELVSTVCSALANLSYSEENNIMIIKAKGISTILTALKAFSSNSNVLEKILRFLYKVIQFKAAADSLKNLDKSEILLSTMKVNMTQNLPQSQRVIELAALCITACFKQQDNFKKQLKLARKKFADSKILAYVHANCGTP